MAKRPRKKGHHKTKFSLCKRCGSRVRKHINRCKKCNEKNF